MHIILVSNRFAKTVTLTLSWRHALLTVVALFFAVLLFSAVFNYAILRYGGAANHPWLQAIILMDQRNEARKTELYVKEHLTNMALKVGELQAQMLRLDGLGEKLAKLAGLKPQELPAASVGRGGPLGHNTPITLDEFNRLLQGMSQRVDLQHDQMSVLETLLMQDAAKRKFLPSLRPVEGGWFSSNFGWRVDPFSGLQSYHEGVDFVASAGTPVHAAASGKVIFAEYHSQYGYNIDIDHGNGLISRYAHCSQLSVKEGDLVVRGQRIATVGSTGRSTGPHLHFEVRLNGVPQNPARFLEVTS